MKAFFARQMLQPRRRAAERSASSEFVRLKEARRGPRTPELGLGLARRYFELGAAPARFLRVSNSRSLWRRRRWWFRMSSLGKVAGGRNRRLRVEGIEAVL